MRKLGGRRERGTCNTRHSEQKERERGKASNDSYAARFFVCCISVVWVEFSEFFSGTRLIFDAFSHSLQERRA